MVTKEECGLTIDGNVPVIFIYCTRMQSEGTREEREGYKTMWETHSGGLGTLSPVTLQECVFLYESPKEHKHIKQHVSDSTAHAVCLFVRRVDRKRKIHCVETRAASVCCEAASPLSAQSTGFSIRWRYDSDFLQFG